MGVEEEYFLIHPESRAPQPAGPWVVARGAATLGDLDCGEFTQCQIEVKTTPCADAARLREQLLRLRVGAAAAEGLRICAGVKLYRAMLADFAAFHPHDDR